MADISQAGATLAADAPVSGAGRAAAHASAEKARPPRGRKWVGYIAFLPFLLVIVGYELLPLAQLVLDSLVGKESGTFGLENFVKVFTTPLYQQSIINSVWISLVSALVGIVVSFLAARFAYESSERVRNAFTMVLNMMSNFSIPFLADFDLYTGEGLLVLYIYFQIPLATLLLLPAFSGIKKSWREAAIILQASPLDYWFRIVIPNLMPSILGTLSVLFSNALAAYATAFAVVMNNYALLPLQITSKFKGDVQIDTATGGALAVVLIILMVICTLINNYFTKRASKGREII